MPSKTKPEVFYRHRGLIERWIGKKRPTLRWREGYSLESLSGVTYPWMIKSECRRDAASRGGRAVFLKRTPTMTIKNTDTVAKKTEPTRPAWFVEAESGSTCEHQDCGAPATVCNLNASEDGERFFCAEHDPR